MQRILHKLSIFPTDAKVMIVGSKLDDVLAVSIPTKQELAEEAAAAGSKEPLSQQKLHRKVLDKGVPEDVMPGILETQVSYNLCFGSNNSSRSTY